MSARIKDKRRTLVANLKLTCKEAISSSDEEWLDQDGDTVDEQRILDTMESASDYERAIEQLDENGKAIVRKLRELVVNSAKIAGNKQKHMGSYPHTNDVFLMVFTQTLSMRSNPKHLIRRQHQHDQLLSSSQRKKMRH